jgi:hypothetical protein
MRLFPDHLFSNVHITLRVISVEALFRVYVTDPFRTTLIYLQRQCHDAALADGY